MSIRLVLADDHPLILDALEGLFRSHGGFEVVAACKNGSEAVKAVRRHRPDVLVLDLGLPDKNGIEVMRELAGDHLPTRTVLLTAAIEDSEMLEALRLGVSGVLLKEMPLSSMIQCVQKVHAGESWLETHSAARAIKKLVRQESGTREAAGLLTPRELEIVRMLGRGLRNKELASRMSISENTVKAHLSRIYAKLKVDGRVALLRYAEDKGLL
jgi:two-component system nitrate/nitrite response regulator NarL